MKTNVVCEILDEIINIEHCPQCQTPLKFRYLTQAEQEKLNFWDLDPEFKKGSQLSQIEVYFCPKCSWEKPSLLVKTEYENVSANEEKLKYQKERGLVEKITSALLPNQSVKIRFVKNITFEGKEKMARAFLFKIPELKNREITSICLSIEFLVKRDKTNPGIFCDALAHELAHVTLEVFNNPRRNPDQKIFPNCSCQKTDIFFNPHAGKGHDKIWHDKYDEFRERIKNENLAKGSGYQALGIDFEYSENSKEEQMRNRPQLKGANQENNKIYWTIGSLVGISISLGLLIKIGKKEAKK